MRTCIFFPLLGAIFVSGCSLYTTPVTQEKAVEVKADLFAEQTPGSVPILFLRDKGFWGSALTISCLIDSKPAVKLREAEQTTIYLQPGPHSIVCQGRLTSLVGRNMPSMYTFFNVEPELPGVPSTQISSELDAQITL